MRVVLAGATGLTGGLLLERLQRDDRVSAVIVLARRAPPGAFAKVEQRIGPIADWSTLITDSQPDVVISALGTTIKAAGSEQAFAEIDQDAVICLARSGRAAGARQMLMVASVGAHQGSRNFYLAIKGRAEAGVLAVGFDRTDIFRPGLLRGARGGDRRIGERLGILVSPVTDFLTPAVLDHYRSIAASDVADAMMRMIGRPETGAFVHENRAMWDAIGKR